MLKVGIQSADWYRESDPLGSFEYIKSCGFEAIDYNIDHYLNGKKMGNEGVYHTLFDKPVEEVCEFFRPLKEASEKTGVIIGQMHAPFPVWFEGMNEVNNYIIMALDKCFAVCEFVGCPAIVVHPLQAESKAREWEINLALYRRLIPIIKKHKGVKICLENIFTRQGHHIVEGRLCNAEEMCTLIDYLNEEAEGDYFGFCFDIGHANLTRRNIKEYIKELGDRLTILHIHDNNGLDDQHIVPYSCMDGTNAHICDWNGFVEGLREIGYQGVLAFETFRIFSSYPAAVHTEVLKLISAIGHHWSNEIEK